MQSPAKATEKKDRYIGDIDPKTKLRHGNGLYKYPNTFFEYQGQWQNNIK